MTRLLRATAGLTLLVTLGAGLAPASTAAAEPRPITLGVSMLPYDHVETLDAFSAASGRDPTIWALWSDWGGPNRTFPSGDLLTTLRTRGITPVINWQPAVPGRPRDFRFRYERIVKGKFDGYIRDWARAARNSGGPVLVRFAHEMNGLWFPWGIWVSTNTPKNHIAAWRHIVGIFRDVGATNVRFVWSPNQPCGSCTPYRGIYPGNKFVDYVGFSSFNWSRPEPWRTMVQVLSPGMAALAAVAPAKPVIVTETGSAPKGGNKAAWITNGYPAVHARWSRLRAIVYFNINMKFADHRDWRLSNPAAAMDAYRAIVGQAEFQGTLP